MANQQQWGGYVPNVVIPTPEPEFWDSSPTKHVGTGRSYEVTTNNKIYRISNIPEDFIGTRGEVWPDDVLQAYKRYKAMGVIANEAFLDWGREEGESQNEARCYIYQHRRFFFILAEMLCRRGFLRKWPNAFEGHGGTDGHWHYADELETHLASAQQLADYHFGRATPQQQAWIASQVPVPLVPASAYTRPLRVYAIGPRYYRQLCRDEKALKDEARTDILNNWDIEPTDRPILFKPSLPPLKDEFEISAIADSHYRMRRTLYNWIIQHHPAAWNRTEVSEHFPLSFMESRYFKYE